MEDEKKKKRNKKKKNNKQTKTTTEAAAGADQHAVTNGKQDDVHRQNQVSETSEIQNVQVYPDDNGHHQPNGTESAILAEAERQHLLQREAVLQRTIKHLQNERESHIQIETTLEEKIKQLQNESDSHEQKVATLEKTIKQLGNENDLYMQKEATLEETIKQLRNGNDSHIQKEGDLEMNIAKLHSEKDFWLQKEVDLEEKISRLLAENDVLNVKEATLEEKVKLLETEKDSQIRTKVLELEESRNNLWKENQQLKENVASLQLQLSSDKIKKGASEPEDFNSQIETACVLVDKLITENVELVEKVNELSVKLDQQSAAAGLSSVVGSTVITIVSDTELLPESSESMSSFNDKLENWEVVAVKEERNGVNHMHAEPTASSITFSEDSYSGEIAQIPLHDNEVDDLESLIAESNEEAAVPLTDAPLIGAPFRLVSFVAKYVSGADLVNKNSSNSSS